MKKSLLFFTIGWLLSAVLTACSSQVQAPKPAAQATQPANLANPASVFCKEQGNRLEIRTASDGSQSGVCVFPDGSECDEWAYFRGECGPSGDAALKPTAAENAAGGYMPPGTAEEISDWWGVIKANQPGAQFDDCFERQDLGQAILFGIDSPDPAVQAQIKALRDSGKIVHLYGTLLSNVPDCNGSQVQVERIVVEGQ